MCSAPARPRAAAPLLLVDLETEEGVTGRAYVFGYRGSGARAIAAVLRRSGDAGRRARRSAPLAIAAQLERRFALIGVTGVVRMALSGLDMAMWDALAVAAGLPLATLLGGAPRRIAAYNSCGLGLMAPEAVADEAERLIERGFKAVKLRLGYPTLEEDLAATRAVRKRLPDGVVLMVDYNQALERRGGAACAAARLQSEGVTGSRSRSATTTIAAMRGSHARSSSRCRSARTSTARQAMAQALDARRL